jgi:hypothetical protein
MKYEAVVIGASAGGLFALSTLLMALPADFPIPVIVVQHRSKEERTLLEEVLAQKCKIQISQVEEKQSIAGGVVYFAPPDYHLLIESNRTFSLSCEARVNYSRPAIDVLFETAARVYQGVSAQTAGHYPHRGKRGWRRRHRQYKTTGRHHHRAKPRNCLLPGDAGSSHSNRLHPAHPAPGRDPAIPPPNRKKITASKKYRKPDILHSY